MNRAISSLAAIASFPPLRKAGGGKRSGSTSHKLAFQKPVVSEHAQKLKLLTSSRKGQFYILTAIVLLTYAFMITRPSAVVQEKRDVFKELYQNFISESPVVVNNALYDGANVSERFASFAGAYADYAITRSPNFRFLYILRDGESMLVGNRLGMSVNVTVAGSSYNVTDRSALTVSPADASVDVAGIVYGFGIGPGAYQVKSLFRQKTDDGLRVYVNK